MVIPWEGCFCLGRCPGSTERTSDLPNVAYFLAKLRFYFDPVPLIPESKPWTSDCEGEGGPEWGGQVILQALLTWEISNSMRTRSKSQQTRPVGPTQPIACFVEPSNWEWVLHRLYCRKEIREILFSFLLNKHPQNMVHVASYPTDANIFPG